MSRLVCAHQVGRTPGTPPDRRSGAAPRPHEPLWTNSLAEPFQPVPPPRAGLAHPERQPAAVAQSLFSFRLTVANRIREPEEHIPTDKEPPVEASAMRLTCTYTWFMIYLG